ncbi:hypothetical protein QTO34_000615 [Cnephaeus nilssonii]|uniref:Uncharacterized protein n=1 Tax=Cnephaeus nilssonii TaxID=3371016 RepID=A0AA40LUT8_CNENI|nr:hypothetical protein QTO34_000615 [Eptesicus nilssonii]
MSPWVWVKLNPGSGRGRVPLDPESRVLKLMENSLQKKTTSKYQLEAICREVRMRGASSGKKTACPPQKNLKPALLSTWGLLCESPLQDPCEDKKEQTERNQDGGIG